MNQCLIRYVIGRSVAPKEPRLLKNGTVSHSKSQDTSASLYADACLRLGTPINEETLEHFKARDRSAWIYSIDFFITRDEAQAVARELAEIAKAIRGKAKAETLRQETSGLVLPRSLVTGRSYVTPTRKETSTTDGA